MVMRRGFGMVEVVVAMTLLGIGVISVSAGAAFSSRLLSLAETEERAARLAAAVLDSLAALPEWTAGTAVQDRLRAGWDAGQAGTEARVVVTIPDQPGFASTYMTTTPPMLNALPLDTAVQ